jgi:hypothetical protein
MLMPPRFSMKAQSSHPRSGVAEAVNHLSPWKMERLMKLE